MATTKIGTKAKQFITLKDKILSADKLHKDKQEKDKKKLKLLELDIMDHMRNENIERADCDIGAVMYKKIVVANVKDFEAFSKYIYKNKAIFLLNKAINNAAYREVLEAGNKIAGLEAFEKESIGISRKRGL